MNYGVKCCKNCQKRLVNSEFNCHSICKEYKDELKEHYEKQAYVRGNVEYDRYMFKSIIASMDISAKHKKERKGAKGVLRHRW